MSEAVTFHLGAGTGRSRKRHRGLAGGPANGTERGSSGVVNAFASNLTPGGAANGKDGCTDDGDPPVVVESVDVVAVDTSSPRKRCRSPAALPDAEDYGPGERATGGEPVSQIARLIERRRRKVSAGALDEDAAYQMDVAECPEEATSDTYSRVPVESFGASLLKRMGWDGKPDARSEALAGAPVSRLRGGEPEGEPAPAFRRKRQRVPPKTNGVDTGAETELASATQKRESEGGTFARGSKEGRGPLSGEPRDDVRDARRDGTSWRTRGDDVRRSDRMYREERRWETVDEKRTFDERQHVRDGRRESEEDMRLARNGHYRGDECRYDRDVDRSRRSRGYASRSDDRYDSDRRRHRADYRDSDDRGRRRDEDERFAPRIDDGDRARRR